MRIVIIVLFVFIVSGCNEEKSNATIQADSTTAENKAQTPVQLVFDKLVGTWQLENGKNFERWTKNDNGTYRSNAFAIKGKDTSWNEQAAIYPENNNWVYENTVKDQNDGKAVKFTSSILTNNIVQFTNPAHDFPTDVNYTVLDENTVHAFIIGPDGKGGRDTVWFNYTRVQ